MTKKEAEIVGLALAIVKANRSALEDVERLLGVFIDRRTAGTAAAPEIGIETTVDIACGACGGLVESQLVTVKPGQPIRVEVHRNVPCSMCNQEGLCK